MFDERPDEWPDIEPPDPPESPLMNRLRVDLPTAVADLRHAYMLMVNNQTKDVPQLARGLIGPSIQRLEEILKEVGQP